MQRGHGWAYSIPIMTTLTRSLGTVMTVVTGIFLVKLAGNGNYAFKISISNRSKSKLT
jgi:hypothetical protein